MSTETDNPNDGDFEGYRCDDCDRAFDTKGGLASHRRQSECGDDSDADASDDSAPARSPSENPNYERADDAFEISTGLDDVLGPDGPVLVKVPSYGEAAAELVSGGRIEDLNDEYGSEWIFTDDVLLDVLSDAYTSPDFADLQKSDTADLKPGALQLFLVPLAPGMFEGVVKANSYEPMPDGYESAISLSELRAPSHWIKTRAGKHGKVACRLVTNRMMRRYTTGDTIFEFDRAATVKLLKHHYPDEYGFGDLTERKAKNAPASALDPFMNAILPDIDTFTDFMGEAMANR